MKQIVYVCHSCPAVYEIDEPVPVKELRCYRCGTILMLASDEKPAWMNKQPIWKTLWNWWRRGS